MIEQDNKRMPDYRGFQSFFLAYCFSIPYRIVFRHRKLGVETFFVQPKLENICTFRASSLEALWSEKDDGQENKEQCPVYNMKTR